MILEYELEEPLGLFPLALSEIEETDWPDLCRSCVLKLAPVFEAPEEDGVETEFWEIFRNIQEKAAGALTNDDLLNLHLWSHGFLERASSAMRGWSETGGGPSRSCREMLEPVLEVWNEQNKNKFYVEQEDPTNSAKRNEMVRQLQRQLEEKEKLNESTTIEQSTGAATFSPRDGAVALRPRPRSAEPLRSSRERFLQLPEQSIRDDFKSLGRMQALRHKLLERHEHEKLRLQRIADAEKKVGTGGLRGFLVLDR